MHLLAADQRDVVDRHDVVGVDVIGLEVRQALVERLGPVRAAVLRCSRAELVAGRELEADESLGDQEDPVALPLAKSARFASALR